jgi:hypothetical protein
MSDVMAEEISDEEAADNRFGTLMDKLESSIHRLKLAADDLSELAETRPAQEHGSAAFVVAETTENLNRLYRDLDAWASSHKHTPADLQPLREHLREIGADKETTDRMLNGGSLVLPL